MRRRSGGASDTFPCQGCFLQAEGAAAFKGPFMAKRITKARCSICRKHGREKFFYMRRRFIFDVDLARKIVSDGRSPMELDRDDLRFAVETCHVNRNHVPHVDPTIPGIVSYVFFPQDDEIVQGHVFIDGHHRAARALQLDQPFFVHVLTEAESQQIVLRSPQPIASLA